MTLNKHSIKGNLAFLIFNATLFTTCVSSANSSVHCSNVYGGFGVGLRQLAWDKGFGDNLLPKFAFQGSLTVGTFLTPALALEVNFFKTLKKNRKNSLLGRDFYWGIQQEADLADDLFGYQSNASMQGIGFNLLGFLPVACEYCLSLFGGIGVNYLNVKLEHHRNTIHTVSAPTPVRHFSGQTLLSQLQAGVQKTFENDFALRFSIALENSAQIGTLRAKENPLLQAKLKNNLVYGLMLLKSF